jgi:putative ABC transport system substrate-binding protein
MRAMGPASRAGLAPKQASASPRTASAFFLADRSPRNSKSRLHEHARLPTAYQRRENVDVGGLLSYGPNPNEQWRQTAFYVDRILKGKNRPICRCSCRRNDLVINLKTAKALGLTVPLTLQAAAIEVIE